MNDAHEVVHDLDMVLPRPVPPKPVESRWRRDLAPGDALNWLRAGWRDTFTQPASSLAYGLMVFLVSVVIVWTLFRSGADYILFPALAGFMVVGPILAVGLYEKSRRLAEKKPVSLAGMVFVRPKSGRQLLFMGVLLCGLMLLWMRAAVIIYALFFGLRPFPGLDHLAPMLFGTAIGWAMLFVGGVIGALFAAFSFASSAVSVPMMMEQRVDALTAMGSSIALVAHNLPVMFTWGVIVLALFLVSLATGLAGLIIVFPVLGHGTWHAYRALAPRAEEPA